MITLFSSPACPFAQRTRALLTRLDQAYQLREVDLDNRDPELLELSPTGKVPFLVDGDLRLFESAIINDYLAEQLGYAGYADTPRTRALQRLVMRRWDDVIAPAFYRSLRTPIDDDDRAALHRELAFAADAVAGVGDDTDNLLALHVAPHWARMQWLRDLTPLPELVDRHPSLRRWLDAAVAVPAVQATLPDRQQTVTRYRQRFANEDATP